MYRCDIWAAELTTGRQVVRANKLWREDAISIEHQKTGYVPKPGYVLESGYTVESIQSTEHSILLIIKPQKKNGRTIKRIV